MSRLRRVLPWGIAAALHGGAMLALAWESAMHEVPEAPFLRLKIVAPPAPEEESGFRFHTS
jgi:hypothetical protein